MNKPPAHLRTAEDEINYYRSTLKAIVVQATRRQRGTTEPQYLVRDLEFIEEMAKKALE
jgi:hypothetical protein